MHEDYYSQPPSRLIPLLAGGSRLFKYPSNDLQRFLGKDMCQNIHYKIISFLEPGAPHCLGNAATGYDSCWSASKLCQMGSDLLRVLPLQEMSEKERWVHKNGWQVQAGEKKGLVWWEHSTALKAHTLPCTCDAVNSRLAHFWHIAAPCHLCWWSLQAFCQSDSNDIKKKMIQKNASWTIFHKNIPVFTWVQILQTDGFVLRLLSEPNTSHTDSDSTDILCEVEEIYHSLFTEETASIIPFRCRSHTGLHIVYKHCKNLNLPYVLLDIINNFLTGIQ